ncbi:MAG TPA: hypothetical protein VK625_13300 [Flavitalea sp.]|nr:hypothetical protein [Flavitalea sp.]
MTFYYTARAAFGKDNDEDYMSWDGYIEWSRLTQLQELVSVDCVLNKVLVEPDRTNPGDWDYIVTDDLFETDFFTSLDYVLRKMKSRQMFNLLTVVIKPLKDCKNIELEDFEFVGYDLLDKEYGNSALTNCGGFEETFLPSDLNPFGLIDNFEKAYDIKRRLLENNPEEHHANTNLIAIWRHKSIGRRNPNR